MSFSRPNNRGTRLGRVVEARAGRLVLKLEAPLSPGDGIEIWTSKGREGISVRRIYDQTGKQEIASALAGETVQLDFTGSVHHGDRIFKTNDAELMGKARLSMREGKEARRNPLKFTISGSQGQRLMLKASDGERQVTIQSQMPAEEAMNKPLTSEYLQKQLGRLGGTPYYLEELTNDLSGNIIVPVKELNEMRRMAVEKLIRLKKPEVMVIPGNIFDERMRVFAEESKLQKIDLPQRRLLTVAVSTTEQVEAAVKAGADSILIGGEQWRSKRKMDLNELQKAAEICRRKGKKLVWRLPRILNEGQADALKRTMKEVALLKNRPAVMAANLAGLQMALETDPHWEVQTDYFLHVFNQKAYHYLVHKGVSSVTLSTELNSGQIMEIAKTGNVQMMVFGDMEMMVSEFCLAEALLSPADTENGPKTGKCSVPCSKGGLFLKDRMNYLFPLESDRECRMHIFNARRLNLLTELGKIAELKVKNIRLELVRADENQTKMCVEIFREAWQNLGTKTVEEKTVVRGMSELERLFGGGFTKGHFYRGVLG